jgi:uncharacterized protein (TIGR03437 family)
VNAASQSPGPVSPGEIVAIYGQNLGPTTLTRLQLTAQGTVDTTLAGVRVLFGGVPSPMIFVRNDVVSAVVPYTLSGRLSTTLQLEYNGVKSNSIDLRVEQTAPGIFTVNQQGTGQGAIQNFPDFSLNGPSNPVRRGGIVTIYLTGEGPTSPAGTDGVIATATTLRNPTGKVTVRIGGVTVPDAQMIYAGSVPTSVLGLAQINVVVPNNAPTGSAVAVDVTVGSNPSQGGVTMAIQ